MQKKSGGKRSIKGIRFIHGINIASIYHKLGGFFLLYSTLT
jgi:hypothetical protein